MSRGRLQYDSSGEPKLQLEDGSHISLKQNRPVNGNGVMLLIDCSGSMAGEKIRQAKAGAIDFAKMTTNKGAAVGVASFESKAVLLTETSTSLDAICQSVQKIETSGSTNMAEGITLANLALGEHKPRTIVLVTDGQPDNKEKALEAADEARLRDIEIICIGVDGADLEFLQLIATVSDMAVHVESVDLQKALVASVDLLRLKE